MEEALPTDVEVEAAIATLLLPYGAHAEHVDPVNATDEKETDLGSDGLAQSL